MDVAHIPATSRRGRPENLLLWALWVVAAIIGGIGLYERLAHGDQAADFSSYVPWGLWVAAYIYFSGLSAGAFLLAAFTYAFRIRSLEPAARLSLFVAMVTMPMGLIMIGLDLGHMERAYLVLVRPQFHSMMAWMVWMYTAYVVLLAAMLAFEIRTGQSGGDSQDSRVRVLAIIGIPLVIGFSGGVGALFATVSAREFWHTAIYPIFFLVGGMTSGTALVSALLYFLWPSRDDAWQDLMNKLSRVLLALLIVEFLVEWAEYSIPYWYRVGSHYEIVAYTLFGPYWYVFWVFNLLLGIIVPVALLARPKGPGAIGFASALVAVTFFACRLNLVIPGLVTPEIRGLESAYSDPVGGKLTFAYMPSWFEWQVLIGVLAVGAALWFIGTRLFPRIFPRSSQSSEV